MTYEEKKAWLWRYRSAKLFERLRLDELATLEAEAMHTTQRYSAMPGGGGDGQALPRAVERIEEAKQAAEAQSTVCDAIRAELMDVFSQLDDEVDFMILFRRYVLLEGWDKIAVHVRLTKRWTLTRHRAAIEKLEIKDSTEQHQTASIQHPESEV